MMLLLPKNATTMLALEHTGMSAHVKETEGTSTSTEERDDLLIRNLGNTKLIDMESIHCRKKKIQPLL